MVYCDAIIRAVDECLISRDGYRRLAMVDPRIEREYRIEGRKHYINETMNSLIPIHDYIIGSSRNNDNNQDGLCSFRSVKALLDILVPIWKKGSSPILVSGDTINLKFGGDGHIVTHQYSHVMFTMCLLNEKDEVLKPSKQYW